MWEDACTHRVNQKFKLDFVLWQRQDRTCLGAAAYNLIYRINTFRLLTLYLCQKQNNLWLTNLAVESVWIIKARLAVSFVCVFQSSWLCKKPSAVLCRAQLLSWLHTRLLIDIVVCTWTNVVAHVGVQEQKCCRLTAGSAWVISSSLGFDLKEIVLSAAAKCRNTTKKV